MKQMCKKKFLSPCVCRNELSNPRCLTEPRLQTTVRQLGLESSIRHTQGGGGGETNNLYPAPLSHLYMHRHSCMCNFLAGLHICHVNKERTHTAVVLFHICLQYTLLYSYNAHLLSTPATFKTQKDIIYKLHRQLLIVYC